MKSANSTRSSEMNLKLVTLTFLVSFTIRASGLGAEDKRGNGKDEKEKPCGMATEICGLTKEEEQKLRNNAKRKLLSFISSL